MTSALRWAVVTTVLTIVASPCRCRWRASGRISRSGRAVAILGVPLAGGVITLAKGTAER